MAPPVRRRRARAALLEGGLALSERFHDGWVELLARLGEDLVVRGRPLQLPDGTGGRSSSLERVRDGEDARCERDLLSRERVRIPAAVPALVVRADDAEAFALEHGDAAEHLLAENGVRLHAPPLAAAQRARLLQDLVGDRDLADVVQQEPVLQPWSRSTRPGSIISSSSSA